MTHDAFPRQYSAEIIRQSTELVRDEILGKFNQAFPQGLVRDEIMPKPEDSQVTRPASVAVESINGDIYRLYMRGTPEDRKYTISNISRTGKSTQEVTDGEIKLVLGANPGLLIEDTRYEYSKPHFEQDPEKIQHTANVIKDSRLLTPEEVDAHSRGIKQDLEKLVDDTESK